MTPPPHLVEIQREIRGYAQDQGIDVEIFHSNSEGDVVDALYDAHDRGFDAALINPAGYMRTTGPLPNAIGQVNFGVGVIFDQFNGVIPDLVYLSNERMKTVGCVQLSGAPEIVVEALSPGAHNEARDRTVKRKLYHENGVSEYWILDLDAKSVEIHIAGRTGGFQSKIVLHENDVITTALLPGFAFPVTNLFPKQI